MQLSSKPQQQSKQRPKPIGESFFDQLKEISSDVTQSIKKDLIEPMPGESLEQLFPWAHPHDAGKPKEEVLFDGGEERKKQEIIARENQNQVRIIEIQKALQQIRVSEQVKVQQQVEGTVQTIIQIEGTAGLERKAAPAQAPQKAGIYHLNFFAMILSERKKDADKANEWRTAQQLRVRSKPRRGVQHWLGDQKTVQEAGATFLLQG